VDSTKIAIILAGPTAVGKTAVGIALAGSIGGEIISADARQIYRGMTIGTCAPVDPPIPHHLVGDLDPRERSTAFRWAELAVRFMEEINSRGAVPLIVGGTGLYLRAIVEGVFRATAANPKIREELYRSIAEGEDLYERLKKIDPVAAGRIHRNNVVRIVRALEVFYSTGETITENFKKTQSPAAGWDFVKIFLDRPREELYRRIDERTEAMLSGGWIEETRGLIDSGIDESAPGMNAIGYREIAAFLRGEIDRKELFGEISQKTRNYSKRQITWFSNRPDYRRIDLSTVDELAAANGIIDKYRCKAGGKSR